MKQFLINAAVLLLIFSPGIVILGIVEHNAWRNRKNMRVREGSEEFKRARQEA